MEIIIRSVVVFITYWLGAAAVATADSGRSASRTGVAGLDATAEVSGVGAFSRPASGE